MIHRFRNLPRSVYVLFIAMLLFTMSTACFYNSFNLALRQRGLSDSTIASVLSWQYLVTLVGAPLFGYMIRGHRLKGLYIGGALVQLITNLLMLRAAQDGSLDAMTVCACLWGLSAIIFKVCEGPYLMRLVPPGRRNEALSLLGMVWSSTLLLVGLTIPLFEWLGADTWQNLYGFSLLGFLCLPFLLKIDNPAPVSEPEHTPVLARNVARSRVAEVLLPHTCIALGAGLMMPYMNMFFDSVHGLDAKGFGLMGSMGGVLIVLAFMAAPSIRHAFGYKISLVGMQTLAVVFLFLLVASEIYVNWEFAFGMAMLAFVIRQPLMNMAQPSVVELSMNHVGPGGHEIFSALAAALWQGSWFVSARIFSALRAANYAYYQIFLITAVMYALGILGFALLIRRHRRLALVLA